MTLQERDMSGAQMDGAEHMGSRSVNVKMCQWKSLKDKRRLGLKKISP